MLLVLSPLVLTNLIIYVTILLYWVFSQIGEVELTDIMISSILIVVVVTPFIHYLGFLVTLVSEIGIWSVLRTIIIIEIVFYLMGKVSRKELNGESYNKE